VARCLNPLLTPPRRWRRKTRRAEKQRAIHSPADLPITADDVVLNVNVGSPLSIAVPSYSSRGGAPLTFKMLVGSKDATLTGDTFDGASSLALTGGITRTIRPFNDGVNTGYGIE
jgi:hypothetical protein